MMTFKGNILALLAMTVGLSMAQAQTTATTTTPAPLAPAAPPTAPVLSPTEQWIKDVKNPARWFSWGGDLRLRNEYFNNAQSLGNPANKLGEQDYFRYRGRIWASITPIADLSLNARLTSEPRTWMRDASYTPFKPHVGTDWTEGVIDSMNVQWRNAFSLPATLTVGRQELMFGEGWLFGDGTPYDGSWTYYMDSARLTYVLKEQQTTIDAVGILQYPKDNTWLPVINPQDRYESEQIEKGAVLYVANKTMPYANLDGYFIYKHDTPNGAYAALGDRGDIFTLGGRVSGLFASHWKYSVEGAYQFGQKQDANIYLPVQSSTAYHTLSAFGVNTRMSYLVNDPLNNAFSVFYEFLSGDNPKTGNDEMFDVLWGRYPRWSELYNIYSYATEYRVGQTDNLHRIGAGWTITPVKNLDLAANYSLLLADQSIPTRTASGNRPLFTQDGTGRGQFLQTVLKYKFSEHLRGHLWAEFVWMGDYYTYRDLMTFLRAEIFMTF